MDRIPEELIVRICPECGAVGIRAWQRGNGYNKQTGEIIPQKCPLCGAWLNQQFWGNVEQPYESR